MNIWEEFSVRFIPLAILFMPIATGLMTLLPSVHLYSFLIIGLGVVALSFLALGYVRTHFEKET